MLSNFFTKDVHIMFHVSQTDKMVKKQNINNIHRNKHSLWFISQRTDVCEDSSHPGRVIRAQNRRTD